MNRRIKKLVLLPFLSLLLGISLLAQERFRKLPPVPEPLPSLKLPPIESFRLSNGLTVAVITQTSHPVINLELIVHAGEVCSPDELPGLAGFTAEMLRQGSLSVSAEDMEERIDSIGGGLSITTSLDVARFSFHFLDEYLDQALEILSQMILQPALANKEITALKRIRYYDILEKQRDPDFLGRRQLLRLLFGSHPYKNGFYNEEVIKNFTRKDILAFYEKFYRPNNASLILVGNLSLPLASRRVSHYFNTWRTGEIERTPLPSLGPNSERRVCLVDLPPAREATLVVGNLIFSMADPDYFPFSVLNQVLGGTPNSRLFMNLRESKGYAYFAFSRTEFYRSGGVLAIHARVVPSASFAAVQEILKELDQLTREKIPTFEIEQAKSRLIGNFPLQVELPSHLADRVSEIITYSLSSAHWERFYDNIMLVDADRVYEVARRYLHLPPIVILVGDKGRLTEFLDRFEKVEIYDSRGNFQSTFSKGAEE